MSIKYKFLSTAFYESIKISILLTTRKRVFTSSKSYIYFNWGILWDLFSPMILVIGFAFLVSIGIRGNGSILDVMIFLFLFWSDNRFWLSWLHLWMILHKCWLILAQSVRILFFFKIIGLE